MASKFIETELGDPVGPNDLYLDNKVIWTHKGVPYQVTILETHSELKVIIIVNN